MSYEIKQRIMFLIESSFNLATQATNEQELKELGLDIRLKSRSPECLDVIIGGKTIGRINFEHFEYKGEK